MAFVTTDPVEALLWYVTFLLSVTLHEASHAWAAMRGGDRTAYLGGQVSLDPLPHIRREPFGMLVLPLISLAFNGWPFGFASTPYDPNWAEANPQKASLMALAGPVANLVLFLISVAAMLAGLVMFKVFSIPVMDGSLAFSGLVVASESGIWDPIAMFVSMLFTMNLLLLLLNMIPFPPLDGSSVIGLVLGQRIARRWREIIRRPGIGIIGLLCAWYLVGPIFSVVCGIALGLIYGFAG